MEIVQVLLNALPPTASVIAMAVIAKVVIKKVVEKFDSIEKTNRRVDFLCEQIKKDHEEKEKLSKQIVNLTLELRGFKRNEEKVRNN